jgi:hypothetical protein
VDATVWEFFHSLAGLAKDMIDYILREGIFVVGHTLFMGQAFIQAAGVEL